MSLRINYNAQAMNAVRSGDLVERAMTRSLERLSSGLRINRASDDAAALSISEAMRSQVRGRHQALSNCQDFINMIGLADGALDQTTSCLQRIRELAVQAANGTQDARARSAIQTEIDQLVLEIDGISSETSFNSKKLLDGSFVNQYTLIGANPSETLSVSINDMSASALGLSGTGTVTTATSLSSLGITPGTVIFDQAPFLSATVTINAGDTLGDFFSNVSAFTAAGVTGSIAGNVITLHPSWIITSFGISGASTSNLGAITNLSTGTYTAGVFPGTGTLIASAPISASGGGISVSSNANANQAISQVDAALAKVNAERSALGATQNRLESTMRNLSVSVETMAAAESRMRDADFADTMTAYARDKIVKQSSTTILAQANLSHMALFRLLA